MRAGFLSTAKLYNIIDTIPNIMPRWITYNILEIMVYQSLDKMQFVNHCEQALYVGRKYQVEKKLHIIHFLTVYAYYEIVSSDI